MSMNRTIAEELVRTAEDLDKSGELLSQARQKEAYEAFGQRFGPDMLGRLDGEELLLTMHGTGNRDSLMYWLEFKNDEEFNTRAFGSIGGGSALKFGIYWSEPKRSWITGSTKRQDEIPLPQAVDIARRQRDDLLRGVEEVARTQMTGDEGYLRLQAALDRAAPTVSNLAWPHKYYHLVSPDRIDTFHNADYGRFNLVRVLEVPPEGEGRFLYGGRFVEIARELGLSLQQACHVLWTRNGHAPYHYWRIGTTEGIGGASRWELMRAFGAAAIGWPLLGDLAPIREIERPGERKDALRALIGERYPDLYNRNEAARGQIAAQISAFIRAIAPGDVVVAMAGSSVLGIGKVTGSYTYREGEPFPHLLPVDWLSEQEWRMDPPEQLQTTVRPLGKNAATLVEIERRILGAAPLPTCPATRPGGDGQLDVLPPLMGVMERISAILERKAQVILYGPPGTGKTYWAERAARELASRAWFKKAFNELTAQEAGSVVGDAVRMCCFHPAYGYEDFLEGYRPETVNGEMVFQRRDGIFKTLCREAQTRPDRPFYLVIDEINRGDIPRIFGELLLVLEKDKRGREVLLPLSGERFSVPPNVYVIGTMNTADRSVALLDAALRRRFGFLELMPDTSLFGDTAVRGLPLRPWLDALNRSIVEHVGRDGRNLQIGHSYFLTSRGRPVGDFAAFTRILAEDIVPLVEEYCYEDYAVLESILGDDLVDTRSQRIRDELFTPDRADHLLTALLKPFPELTARVTDEDAETDSAEADGTDGEMPEPQG